MLPPTGLPVLQMLWSHDHDLPWYERQGGAPCGKGCLAGYVTACRDPMKRITVHVTHVFLRDNPFRIAPGQSATVDADDVVIADGALAREIEELYRARRAPRIRARNKKPPPPPPPSSPSVVEPDEEDAD